MKVGSLTRTTVAGAVLVALIFVANAWLSLENLDRLAEEGAIVSHSDEIIQRLGDVMGAASEAESLQRAFLLSGDEDTLPAYRKAIREATDSLAALRRLTADSATQQQHADVLENRLTERFRLLDENLTLAEPAPGGKAEAAERTRRGRRIMAEAAAASVAMREHEQSLLDGRKDANHASFRRARWSVAIVTTTALGASGAGARLWAGPISWVARKPNARGANRNASLARRSIRLNPRSRSSMAGA